MTDTLPGPIAPHQPPPPFPYAAPPQPPPRRPRSRGLVAAALTGSLLLCAGAAAGGAAAYDTWFDEDPSPTVVTQQDTDTEPTADLPPAAAGSVEAVAAKVLPSVVKIDVAGPGGTGSGSGIVLTEDGRILTNNHVVELAGPGGSITVSFSDGSTAEAEIVGTDPLTDTALIQAEGVSGRTPATIGSSAGLRVGQEVVAIGSPFGLDATVTSGIVSALDRPVNVGSDARGNSTTYPAIQTDAAINPGNSGGPLVDMSGAVVGINSSIRTAASQSGFGQESASGSIGLGFAIPIDEVMPIVDQMSAGETPTHARLGLKVGDPQEDGTEGALVSEVTAGSTADDGGLEAGDVITKIDGQRISGADSLVATIRSYRPGDSVTVTWVRGDDEQSADFVLDSDGE